MGEKFYLGKQVFSHHQVVIFSAPGGDAAKRGDAGGDERHNYSACLPHDKVPSLL